MWGDLQSLLASGAKDRTVKLWDISAWTGPTGIVEGEFPDHSAILSNFPNPFLLADNNTLCAS